MSKPATPHLSARRRAAVLAAVVLAATLASGVSEAADPRITSKVDIQALPRSHQTPAGLYVRAEDAYAVVTRHKDVLLIDVRTYGETIFNGVAPQMHRHIPYVTRDDDHTFDERLGRYKLVPNPDFVKAVDNLLAERRLDRTATVIVGCSIGERSAKAASLLAQSGFSNVYSMVDGFEGLAGAGTGRGWKGSGLPWTFEMKPAQAYKSPSF